MEIGNGGTRSGNISIGSGTGTTGSVFISRNGGNTLIGTSGSTNTIDGNNTFQNGSQTLIGATNINTSGTANTSIGNATGTTSITASTATITGTTNINTSGTANTSIGNATGTLSFNGTTTCNGNAVFNANTTLGSDSNDSIIPNGTLTKPFIIGTYSSQSSYSTTSETPLTTYLGGTLYSTKTLLATSNLIGTGTLNYLMKDVSPYDANGGVSLTRGTYMVWFALNWDSSGAFELTDIRMGIAKVNTLTASSTESDYINAVFNLTCYFHKTDATNAATSDSENRVVNGIFNISTTSSAYPFLYQNVATSSLSILKADVFFTKIGT